MLIGELSKKSQLSRDTIRYYEKIGLFNTGTLRKASNNYKHYSLEVLDRIHQINILKKSGFTLKEIRLLFQSEEKHKICIGLPERLESKIAAIERKIAEFASYKTALTQIYQACTGTCESNRGMPNCIDNGNPSVRS